MKKIISILAILALAVFSASAADVIVEKNYNLKDFRGLEISSTFDVTVEQSDTYSISIAVLSEYAPYLDIRVTGGILNVGFKNLPKRLNTTSYIKSAAAAKICMPSLERLSLSGASTFSTADSFDAGNNGIQISVSGASELKHVEMYGTDARITVSGASRASITGGFVDIDMAVSGTSRATLAADAEELNVTASGTAVADIEGEYEDVELSASGVAHITVKGQADELDATGSGTASIDVLKMPVNSAEVSLSGASVCKTYVQKELEASCSGASTLSYKSDNEIKLELKQIARTATLKKL